MRLGGFRIVLMILTSWLVVIVLLIKLLIRVGIFLFYVAEAMVVVPYRIVRMITCAVQGRKYA